MLPVICREGALIGSSNLNYAGEDGRMKQGSVFGLRYGESPLQIVALVVGNKQEKTNEFWSAYPVCSCGVENRLKVNETIPDRDGTEGVINASTTFGGSIGFFDPYFFLNKDGSIEGSERNVSLAGLAYVLRKAEQDGITINEGPMIQEEKDRVLRENPHADVSKITSVFISMKGAALYLPLRESPDEGEFRICVDEVEFFRLGGREYCRIRGVLMRDDDNPLVADIYASGHVLEGYKPAVGDDIEGICWMQGFFSNS